MKFDHPQKKAARQRDGAAHTARVLHPAGGWTHGRAGFLCGGFTLMELVLVMVIMVVIVGFIAPTLGRSFKQRGLDQQALLMLSLTEYGRSEAVSQGIPTEVWLDPVKGDFGVEAMPGYTGDKAGAGSVAGSGTAQGSAESGVHEKQYSLPDDVHFEVEKSSTHLTAKGFVQVIQFDPDGAPTTGTGIDSIRIVNKQNDFALLILATDGWGYEITKEDPNAPPYTDRHPRAEDSGFTLVEVMAALLFLAILIPAIAETLSISSRVSELSNRRAVATELAENQLNQELIGNYWQSPDATQGDFGADYPGYTWQMTQTGWAGDTASNMTELTVEVAFPVQGREQSVKLTTLVSTAVAQQQTQPQSSGTSQTTAAPAAAAPAASGGGGGGRGGGGGGRGGGG